MTWFNDDFELILHIYSFTEFDGPECGERIATQKAKYVEMLYPADKQQYCQKLK